MVIFNQNRSSTHNIHINMGIVNFALPTRPLMVFRIHDLAGVYASDYKVSVSLT